MEAIQHHAELQALEISDPVLQPVHPYRSQENRLAVGASTCPAPKYSHTPRYAPQIGVICSPTSLIYCHRKHLHQHSLILGVECCLCLQKQRRKSQTPATTEQLVLRESQSLLQERADHQRNSPRIPSSSPPCTCGLFGSFCGLCLAVTKLL